MVYDYKRIPYRIDRPLTGLAGPDYDATISFGLPVEPEDSQYGKSRMEELSNPLGVRELAQVFHDCCLQFVSSMAIVKSTGLSGCSCS